MSDPISIQSEADYNAVVAEIDALIRIGAPDDLPAEQQDRLNTLGNAAWEYDAEHCPIIPASDAEMLRHLIESRETTQTHVAKAAGIAESTISAVMTGKRRLTRKHVAVLSRHFKVSPGVFLANDMEGDHV